MYHTQITIIGSNVGGCYSLFDIGFYSHIGPATPEAFAPMLVELYANELAWEKIHKEWRERGHERLDAILGAPGAIVWKIRCAHPQERRLLDSIASGDDFKITRRIARKLLGSTPHLTLEFPRELFDPMASAIQIVEGIAKSPSRSYRLGAKTLRQSHHDGAVDIRREDGTGQMV